MTDLIVPEAYQPLFWYLDSEADLAHPQYRYFGLPGGRASGKSTDVATSLALRGSLFPTRNICTREIQKSLDESVKALLAKVIDAYDLPGYSMTETEIKNINGTTFNFSGMSHNPESTIKGFEGANVCWIEEAQTVSKRSLDILIPTIREQGSQIIATWNPLTPADPIEQRLHTNISELDADVTYYRHTTYRDLDDAGLLNPEIKRMIDAAKDTPEFAHIWEGLPYEKIINQIISWQALEHARKRKPDTEGGVSFGVDVARYGNDRTAVAIKRGHHLEDIQSWRHRSLVESAETIKGMADSMHPVMINVDDTGIGGGLTDVLLSYGLPVNPVQYAATAKRPDKYPNVASELWFDLADQLDTMTINPLIDELQVTMQELTTRQWKIDSRNRRAVQPKKEWKAANMTGSPDLADAVTLAYYLPPVMPSWDVSII